MNNTENKIQTISQFISKQLKLKELPATKIFDLCHKQSFDNNDILSALKQLTDDKTVISHNKCFYLTKNLNVQNGYVHSNITGLLWVENIDKTNSFGVCFNVPEKITPIGNKKEATIGTKCAYVELVDGDSKFVYILSTEPHKSINLVAVKKHRSWVSINNNYYSRLKVEKDLHDELSTLEDGDIIQLQQSLDGMKLSHKIGNISDKGIESIIVKTIAEVNQPPSNSVEHVTNKSTKVLSNEFITIDSIHTKDIDDAISIEKTDDGYKLFVAIANVDAVIPKDSQEDLFAQKNATTFYLEFERIPMFHEGISESICSLNIGEEKPAFICEVNFDNNGVQKNYSFYESTIKVSYKTPYEDVDIIFNGDSPLNSFYTNDGNVQKILGDIPQNLSNQLNNLKTLTDFLKKNKIKQDYWFLKTPEYILGENGKIDHLAYREETDTISQSIVENCMLTANICAANILRKNAPNIGIFRNQTTKIDFEKPLPATYETNNEGHWGLQEETYTHFTSPIRRYCDLIVHRLIKAIIYNKPQPYTENEMQNIVKNINEQQYKHKQMNSKERIILNQEYLHNLVSTENLKSKFELASYNSNGCVFINKQLVEIFLPQFKVEKSIVDYINENIEDKDIQKHIDHVNNYWQFKGFIDKYHWLDSKKEVTMKFYPKEHKIEQERKLKIV